MSQTKGVDCTNDAKDDISDSSEEKSCKKDSDLNLSTSNNCNHNLPENIEQNDNDKDLNLCLTSDAHAKPEEVVNRSENDNTNNKNANEMINAPEQDSNLSIYGRPVCIHRPEKVVEVLFNM